MNMLSGFLFLLTLFSSASWAQTLKLDGQFFKKDEIQFISVEDEIVKRNKVVLKLPKGPVEKFIKSEIKPKLGETRELFTTVPVYIELISPDELEILTNKLKESEVIRIANSIQKDRIRYKIECLASHKKVFEEKEEVLYFFVHEGNELRTVRDEINLAYVNAGGAQEDFRPFDYTPITYTGFSNPNMLAPSHFSRDKTACIPGVSVEITEPLSPSFTSGH